MHEVNPPNFEISLEGLSQPENFKRQVQKVANDIVCRLDRGAYIKVHLELLSKEKKHYSLSILVYCKGETLFVKKTGKKTFSLMRKAKKSLIRKIAKLEKTKSKKRSAPPRWETNQLFAS